MSATSKSKTYPRTATSSSSSPPTMSRYQYKTLKKRSPKSPSKVNIHPVNIDVRPKKFKQKNKMPFEEYVHELDKQEAKRLLVALPKGPDTRSERRKAEEARWNKSEKERNKRIQKIVDNRENMEEIARGFIGDEDEQTEAAVAHIAQMKKARLKGMSLTGKRKRLGEWIKKQFTRGGRKRGNKRKTMRK